MESWESLTGFDVVAWTDRSRLPDDPYLARALEAAKYSNASNFMRLWALHRHGGLYFDTDVEVVGPFDGFLRNRMFFGWQDPYRASSGLMGAEAGHPVLAELIDRLTERFDGTETSYLSGPDLFTDYLWERFRLMYSPRVVRRKWLAAYPERYFFPTHFRQKYDLTCGVTAAKHHWTGLWMKEPANRRRMKRFAG
jgi:hypothetical protein